jgi:hypothetical protein
LKAVLSSKYTMQPPGPRLPNKLQHFNFPSPIGFWGNFIDCGNAKFGKMEYYNVPGSPLEAN